LFMCKVKGQIDFSDCVEVAKLVHHQQKRNKKNDLFSKIGDSYVPSKTKQKEKKQHPIRTNVTSELMNT